MIKDVASPINGQMYNKYMFGENCADQLQLVYSTWELWNGGSTCFFSVWMLPLSPVLSAWNNSQTISREQELEGKLMKTQLNYRMELARQLIGNFRGARKREIVSNTDNCGQGHWPVKIPKRGRCKQCTSEKRRQEVYIQCKTCQIYLCIDNGCFEKWHIQIMEWNSLCLWDFFLCFILFCVIFFILIFH